MVVRCNQICVRLSDDEVDELYKLSESLSLNRVSFIRLLIKQYGRRFDLTESCRKIRA